MLESVSARCLNCGEIVEVEVDPSGGAGQLFVEDCPVCCSPYEVRIALDEWGDATLELSGEI